MKKKKKKKRANIVMDCDENLGSPQGGNQLDTVQYNHFATVFFTYLLDQYHYHHNSYRISLIWNLQNLVGKGSAEQAFVKIVLVPLAKVKSAEPLYVTSDRKRHFEVRAEVDRHRCKNICQTRNNHFSSLL